MATSVRRTEFQDQARIDALIAEEGGTLAKRFGDFEVTTLIETAMLCISAVDEAGDVVGFATLHDHPAGRPEIPAAAWPEWFHMAFAHSHLGPANVAWLSYFVCDPTVHAEVAENVLRTAFTTMPEVDAVLLCLPTHVNPFTPLKDTFEELTPQVPHPKPLPYISLKKENPRAQPPAWKKSTVFLNANWGRNAAARRSRKSISPLAPIAGPVPYHFLLRWPVAAGEPSRPFHNQNMPRNQ
jgi:hypothetical protein